MRVSKMIKNLQEFLEEHGDLDCWYAKDDEGNGYQEIHYTPSIFYVDKSDEIIYGSLEDAEECDANIAELTPICIVN